MIEGVFVFLDRVLELVCCILITTILAMLTILCGEDTGVLLKGMIEAAGAKTFRGCLAEVSEDHMAALVSNWIIEITPDTNT